MIPIWQHKGARGTKRLLQTARKELWNPSGAVVPSSPRALQTFCESKEERTTLMKYNEQRHDLSPAPWSTRQCLDPTVATPMAQQDKRHFAGQLEERESPCCMLLVICGETETLYPLFSSFLMGRVRV